jgi:hypothetical protein
MLPLMPLPRDALPLLLKPPYWPLLLLLKPP